MMLCQMNVKLLHVATRVTLFTVISQRYVGVKFPTLMKSLPNLMWDLNSRVVLLLVGLDQCRDLFYRKLNILIPYSFQQMESIKSMCCRLLCKRLLDTYNYIVSSIILFPHKQFKSKQRPTILIKITLNYVISWVSWKRLTWQTPVKKLQLN